VEFQGLEVAFSFSSGVEELPKLVMIRAPEDLQYRRIQTCFLALGNFNLLDKGNPNKLHPYQVTHLSLCGGDLPWN
jgi:hypothetical protein